AFHNISFSNITANTERQSLGRVMSDFTAIGEVGRIPLVSFVAFAAAYSVGTMPGWRAVCLAYGVLALCAAMWLFYTAVKKSPSADASTQPGEPASDPLP
ncbi:MFS transporter, partial [Desulfovibrio desulfuricans]|nr:MFS transporter [Desulfovibrio desulfuricans]